MKDRKNNKGFTLIELLAVLVILSAIMGIAIPTISSSLERNKDKQDKAKIKILENAAELYVSDYKNEIYTKLGNNTTCCISINKLVEENLVSDDAVKKSSGESFNGYIRFNKSKVTYEYVNTGTCSSTSSCR